MGNRRIPFGYTMQQGIFVHKPEECRCVQMIYDRYLHGESYKAIADKLRESGVQYEADRAWNKNMVARILENKRYTGIAPFPSIITEEQFDAVSKLRADKKTDIDNSPAIRALRKLCDGKITPNIERQVLFLLNGLIEHPMLVHAIYTESHDQLRLRTLREKLDDIMLQQPINEELANQLIYEIATAEYACIASEEYETIRIQGLLQEAEPSNELDDVLLQKCVARVLKITIRTVCLKLKNGQIIERSMFP